MKDEEILRMYACAALQGMIARRNDPVSEAGMNSLAKQAWLMACEMRLVELENGES
jgi:hypothetical protein